MAQRREGSSGSFDALKRAATKARLELADLHAAREWLAEQLLAHEYAKLGQGGHTNTQVPLRQVFVDLPVSRSQTAESQHGGSRVLFLEQLQSSPPLKLRDAFKARSSADPSATTVDDQVDTDRQRFVRTRTRQYGLQLGATLLIGGPGQGKSTLGQLACQLHRVALLKPLEAELKSGQRDIVRSFSSFGSQPPSRKSKPSLSLPKRPFLPLQIALPDLAAWLAKEQPSTATEQPALLRFIADLPSARSCKLNASTLFVLAVHMPSLLVLDGFDEVGATQDRERIVSAARELLMTLAQHAASAQVLATTRPQGYAGELAQIGIPFFDVYLVPLKREEALEYARKLVDAKIPGADQQATMLARLEEAAAEPATQRLLTTPLQVTILTALVQQLGRAPRERWNLFSRYFAYTYDREIERNTYASALLAHHRSHIERIHARVALLLQVEAERDGGASARMPRVRLGEVIDAVLGEDEISPDERKRLVSEISVAAEQRLVFLVEPEPGSFGFEIRSLQEFMAAWALGSGRDAEVEARLQQVAKAAMFRNVILFMASRLFSEGSPLRDVLSERICTQLDDERDDQVAGITRSGALLALEILEEGAVLSQPKRARALMARATGLLSIPPGAEHVRLARVVNSDTVSILSDVIEQCLSAPANSVGTCSHAAWLCLVDATNRGEDWAIQLGDRYWCDLPSPASLLGALDSVDMPLGPWIVNKIEQRAEAISPELFVHRRVTHHELSSWASWLHTVFARRVSSHVPWGARSLAALDILSTPNREHAPAAWTAWIAAAVFEINPSAAELANALYAIARSLPKSNFEGLRWCSSWPLATCIAAAESASDLLSFSDRLRSGELGDIHEWRRAEEVWQKNFDPVAVLDGADDVPWSTRSIRGGPPLFAVSPWVFVDHVSRSAGPTSVSAIVNEATQRLRVSVSHTARRRLADICLLLYKHFPPKLPRRFDVKKLLETASHNPESLVPRPPSISLAEWAKLLDSVQVTGTETWYAPPEDVFEALQQLPGHHVLLRLAVSSVALASQHLAHQLTPALLQRVSEVVKRQETVVPSGRADLAILRIFVGAVSPEEETALLQEIATAASERPSSWGELFQVLRASRLSESRISSLLVKAYSKIGSAHRDARIAIEQLRELLQKRRSDLDNHTTWSRLTLPLPPPKPPLHARLEGRVPSQPVWVESLGVHDIGGLHQLTLTFKLPTENKGQWVLILGPNGSGKTTLLRSLAVALRNAKDPAIWPRGAFSQMWQRLGDGTDEANIDSRISVKLSDGIEHTTVFRSNGSMVIAQLPQHDQPRLFPLFAYGCRRGSALGGAAREVNLSDDDGPEVATLFDEGAALIHAETWLLQLEGDAPKSERSRMIFHAVIEALKILLSVQVVQVRERKLWITERNHPSVPFSSLSDGYLTSAGWFLDLVARWITLAERSNYHVEADFLQRMTGLVLIDEVDLHLHPRWQIEIITRTRRLLPQMSFVVTTHSPLTLVGAKAEEIWILSTEGARVKATCGVDTPMLLSGGQIYRRYFGIQDIYPDELGRSLQRYAFLSAYAARTDAEQAELDALEQQLREAGIDPGWETVARTEGMQFQN